MHHVEAAAQLRAVQAQVNAIAGLLDEPDRCVEAVARIRAAQHTLHQVTLDLLAQHLTSCVTTAAQQNESDCQVLMGEIQELFRWANRVGLVT